LKVTAGTWRSKHCCTAIALDDCFDGYYRLFDCQKLSALSSLPNS